MNDETEKKLKLFLTPNYYWLISDDKEHYEFFSKEAGFLILPTKEDIVKNIRNGEVFNVLAPYKPPEEFEDLFIVEKLYTGAFSKQEKEYIEKVVSLGYQREKIEMRLLEDKTGVRIYKPSITFSEVIGMKRIKEEIAYIKEFPFGSIFFPKALMLVGVPGTGKSLTAKAIAGETNRYLVEINLQKLLESSQPVERFERILTALENLKIECVLWVDEIEKAIGEGEKERKLMGRFLTILQEFNTPTGYSINGFFYITANNIILLMEKYPEFFRSGRIDVIFFIDFPTFKNAKELFSFYYDRYIQIDKVYPVQDNKRKILSYYLNFFKKKEVKEKIISKFITLSTDIYNTALLESPIFRSQTGEELFVYVPAEIENIVKKFFAESYLFLLKETFLALSKNKNLTSEQVLKLMEVIFENYFTKELDYIIEKTIRTIQPIGLNKAMEEGIKRIKAMKDMFVNSD
jgi:SpoVK/Ycf46/Vps4 family AAA+-type ATPase